MVGMKTSVTRKKDEGGPHGRDEDLSDEETGGERSSLPLCRPRIDILLLCIIKEIFVILLT